MHQLVETVDRILAILVIACTNKSLCFVDFDFIALRNLRTLAFASKPSQAFVCLTNFVDLFDKL